MFKTLMFLDHQLIRQPVASFKDSYRGDMTPNFAGRVLYCHTQDAGGGEGHPQLNSWAFGYLIYQQIR